MLELLVSDKKVDSEQCKTKKYRLFQFFASENKVVLSCTIFFLSQTTILQKNSGQRILLSTSNFTCFLSVTKSGQEHYIFVNTVKGLNFVGQYKGPRANQFAICPQGGTPRNIGC